MSEPFWREEVTDRVSVEELAQSAYRAFAAATGVDLPPWEKLPLDDQAPFKRLVRWAEGLEEMEGAPYVDVACQGHACANGHMSPSLEHFASLPVRERTAWEAAVRHLAFLADSGDEVDDIGKVENNWRAWAERRMSEILESPV